MGVFLDGIRGGQYLGFNAGGLQLSDLSKFIQPTQSTRGSKGSGGDGSDAYEGLRGETNVFAQREADVNNQLSSIQGSMEEAYSNYEYTGDKKYLNEVNSLNSEYVKLRSEQTSMLSGRNTLKTRLDETVKHYDSFNPNSKLLTSQGMAFGYQPGENLLGRGKTFSTPIQGLNYAHQASGLPENYMKPGLNSLYGYGYGKEDNMRTHIDKVFNSSENAYTGVGRINEQAIEKDANTGSIINKWYEIYDRNNTGNVNTVVTGIYSNLTEGEKSQAKSDVLNSIEKFNLTGNSPDLIKATNLALPYMNIERKEGESDEDYNKRVKALDDQVLTPWKQMGFDVEKNEEYGMYVIGYDPTKGIPNDPTVIDNMAKLYTMNTALEISGAYTIIDHKESLNRFSSNSTRIVNNMGGEDVEHKTINKLTRGLLDFATGNDSANKNQIQPVNIFGSTTKNVNLNGIQMGGSYEIDFDFPLGGSGPSHVQVGDNISSLSLTGFNAVMETGTLSEMPEFVEYGQKGEIYYPKAFKRDLINNDNMTFKPLISNDSDVLGISTLDQNYFKFSDKRVLPFGKASMDKTYSRPDGTKGYKYEQIIMDSPDYSPEAKEYLVSMFNEIEQLNVFFRSGVDVSEMTRSEFQRKFKDISFRYNQKLSDPKYIGKGITQNDIELFLLNVSRMADYKFSNQLLNQNVVDNPALRNSNKIHNYDPTNYGINIYPKSFYHDTNDEWSGIRDKNGGYKAELYMGVNAERVVDINASGFGNYSNLSFAVNTTNVDKDIYPNNYSLEELMGMAYPTERSRKSQLSKIETVKGSSADKLNVLINDLSSQLGITIVNPYTRGSADNVLLISNVYIPFTFSQAIGTFGGKQDVNLYKESVSAGLINEGEDAINALARQRNN